MSDNDRDRDRETVDRTTIVETGGDRGSGGVLAVVLLIIVVLVVGFGRFGQIVSQYLLAEEVDVTAMGL